MTDKKYVVVTSVVTTRRRYVMPIEWLAQQSKVTVDKVDPMWAADYVTCQEIEPFSEMEAGEQILDTFMIADKEIIELFDNDLGYIQEWSAEDKFIYINNPRLVAK